MIVQINLPANTPQSVKRLVSAPTVDIDTYQSGKRKGEIRSYAITCEWSPDPLAAHLGFGGAGQGQTVVHIVKTKEEADKTLDYWTQIYHDPSLLYDENFFTSFWGI